MTTIENSIKAVKHGHDLSEEDAKLLFDQMTSGAFDDDVIATLLLALSEKGESESELLGAAKALRAKAKQIKAPAYAIDTCGTGGDHSGTVNISTAVAFVVAACGVPVAKHGNRSVTSRSGSADVLEALGVNIEADATLMEQALHELNICFMMAPLYHPSMKYVASVRKSLGVRTIFNKLGPLINPANVKYQLLGVYDVSLLEPMAHILKKLGTKSAWVVHGHGGLDELSISGTSHVYEMTTDMQMSYELDPQEYGFSLHSGNELVGGNAVENADRLLALLSGETHDAYLDVVVLNAAACLVIVGKYNELSAAIKRVQSVVKSGKPRDVLEQFRTMVGLKSKK